MKNEPAFPIVGHVVDDCGRLGGQLHHGMTLRDYFAAKAMQALLTNGNEHCVSSSRVLARDSYEVADAMLKAREEGR